MRPRRCNLTGDDGPSIWRMLASARLQVIWHANGRQAGCLAGHASLFASVSCVQAEGARLCRAPSPSLLHAAFWLCLLTLSRLSEQSCPGVLQSRSSQPPKPYYERTPDPFAKPEDLTPKIPAKVGAGWCPS